MTLPAKFRDRFLAYTLMTATAAAALAMSGCGEREPVPVVPSSTSTQASSLAPDSIASVRVFGNLTFDQPTYLTWVPGPDDRLVVLEQAGKVLIFPNREDVRQAQLFLDLTDKVTASGEQGLLGIAFDPAYGQNGHFYVYYSASDPRRSVVERYQVSGDDPNRADPESGKIILEVAQPEQFSNHKAGTLAFGQDGKLYISLGDGGGSGDPDGNGQRLDTLLGKILRIDPNAGDPYAIPQDNPFAGKPGARGEIWAYGFRNPYRFSFDRATGELWAGDVGEGSREEIDLVVSGGNFGWNLFEGTREFENPDARPPEDFLPPVIEYGRDQGRSIIGGYVYQGTVAKSLRGAYIYGDYYSGKVWALLYREGQVVFNDELTVVPGVSSFGEDRSGEIFLTSHSNGQIYRLRELS